MAENDKGKTENETPLGVEVDPVVSCYDMVAQYLSENDYDGLCDPEAECECDINDLMPCGGEYAMQCEAGHKVICGEECGQGCSFHIVAGKKVSR